MSHVFISYSKHNRDYARKLADHLLAEGFDVWIDDRIDYGTDWWDAIDQAIQNCGAVIVIMSPEAKVSRWVQREVSLSEDRGKPVFPLLLSGNNWSIFVRTQYADVANGSLPSPEYFDDLARHVPRRDRPGEEISPRSATAPGRAQVMLRPRRRVNRAVWWIGIALVFIAALALIVLQIQELARRDALAVTPTSSAANVDRTIASAPMTGVNLDVFDPVGHPNAFELGKIGWVRLVYNVSYNPANQSYGNIDLLAARQRYQPYLEQYTQAGYKVILALTHQTFGEGAGYNWADMDEAAWNDFVPQFAEVAGQIAEQYKESGLVSVYQIWNEQDMPPEMAYASVPMPPATYAQLLAQTIPSVRAADPSAFVITGGHISGAQRGAVYARTVLEALPDDVRPDGIAFHPYGLGVTQLDDQGFVPFGAIDEMIDSFSAVLPDAPVWITEWGVLDRPEASADTVAQYATNLIARLGTKYTGKVAAAVWYAWADGMANGYGLVDASGHPKQPLYNLFLGI